MGKRINKIAVLSQPFFCYGVVAFAVENYVHELQKKKKTVKLHRRSLRHRRVGSLLLAVVVVAPLENTLFLYCDLISLLSVNPSVIIFSALEITLAIQCAFVFQ